MTLDHRTATPAPASPAGGAPPAPAARELTRAAISAGLLVGALLCSANVYMGLKTGWWDSGSITGSIVAFALLSAWGRARGRQHGALENNVAQAVAASCGAMPAAAGLLGAVPALALVGREPAPWAIAALGLPLAVLGILVGLALRRRLLEQEALPFPTGVATAEVVSTLHSGRGGATRGVMLAASSVGSAVALLLRDVAGVVPQVSAWPGRIAGLPASALGVGMSWSPLLVGAGLLAGLQTGLSVLLGAAIAWTGLAPALVRSGRVAGPDFGSVAAWLTWPGVALILGSSLASLVRQARELRGTLADLAAATASRGGRGASDRRTAIALAVASVALVLGVGRYAFGVGLPQLAGALAIAVVLATVCARAVGRTDIAPVGEMGQLTQGIVGALSPGHAASNITAGHVVAGEAAQTGVTLWSLQSGRRLGSSPAALARGMLLGAAAGAVLAVPAYLLLVRAHGLGTPALPAPAAIQWRAVGEVMAGGTAALPTGAAPAAAVALVAGVLLELLSRGRAGRYLPAPAAVGMGFITPASYAVAICAGSLAASALRRLQPGKAEARIATLGAGAIAGESALGFVLAALTAAGVLGAGR